MTEASIFMELFKAMPTLAPLLVLVWFLKVGNDKMIGQLNAERKDRLDGMKDQIGLLEQRSDRCEQDRVVLHRENAALHEQMEALRHSKQQKLRATS